MKVPIALWILGGWVWVFFAGLLVCWVGFCWFGWVWGFGLSLELDGWMLECSLFGACQMALGRFSVWWISLKLPAFLSALDVLSLGLFN